MGHLSRSGLGKPIQRLPRFSPHFSVSQSFCQIRLGSPAHKLPLTNSVENKVYGRTVFVLPTLLQFSRKMITTINQTKSEPAEGKPMNSEPRLTSSRAFSNTLNPPRLRGLCPPHSTQFE